MTAAKCGDRCPIDHTLRCQKKAGHDGEHLANDGYEVAWKQADARPCNRCRKPVNAAVWPGDLGYDSAICLNLDEIEASSAETIRRMNNLAGLLGYRGRQ